MPDDYDDRPRRRRKYDDDDGDDDDYDRPRRRRKYIDGPRRNKSNGLAVAALILGLLSLVTTCLTGIPAVVCGMLAMGKPTGRGMAITGLLLGILGTVEAGVVTYLAFGAAERSRDRIANTNNMQQMALAFHNQDSAIEGMTGPYHVDRQRVVNAGLSWRVGLLPYVEQDSLYRGFKTDEAWDGPTNKSLSNTPLKVYTSPHEGQKASVNTPYRVFYGGGAIFNESGKPVSITEMTDGTTNTILVVQAWDQVPWAAPRDFKYDPKGPLPKLGHPKLSGGFHAALADGSVRFVSDKVSEKTLRAAITRNGGEMMAVDW
jgi:hypothetical protein